MAKDDVYAELDDPFELGSGFLDDFDGTVKDQWFEFDPEYNDGETLVLKLEMLTDDEDEPETTQLYPCGDGWETDKDGKVCKREDGKTKPFNKKSGVGLLIGAANDAGATDTLRERFEGEGLGPFHADWWHGLTFHWKRTEINYGGEIGTRERLLPEKFIGEEKAGGKRKATRGGEKKKDNEGDDDGKPKRRRKKADEEKGEGEEKRVDEAAVEAITEIAAEVVADNDIPEDKLFETFVQKCYEELEGLEGNKAAEELVNDDSDDSIYGKEFAKVAE